MKSSPEHRYLFPKGEKGGVLLTAVFFAFVSALTVGSFIALSKTELRHSHIQFFSNESMNLAEAGLEEALHALNFYDWTGWNIGDGGNTATLAVTNIDLGQTTGEFQVLVESRLNDPVITAQGRVMTSMGVTITRQVQITVRKRSFFANGITARDQILFSGGNAYVDSYRSSEGPFSSARRRDRGTVASISVDSDPVVLGNGHIWGYVFTGGEMPRIRQGTILGEDSPSGINIDTNRIARDFSAELPSAVPPPPAHIHYDSITSSMTLGTPGACPSSPTIISTNRISLTEDLNIIGPVILIVRGDISFSGSGGLTVGLSESNEENALLRVYSYGDFRITGKGMGNLTRVPSNLVIFGMHEDHQTFALGGNARWEAAIYAPNADLTLNGGGNEGHMSGAVVGKSVTINGGSKFHYDEDLAGFSDAFGFALESWRELYRAEDRIQFN